MPLEAPVTTAIRTPASLRADANDALGFCGAALRVGDDRAQRVPPLRGSTAAPRRAEDPGGAAADGRDRLLAVEETDRPDRGGRAGEHGQRSRRRRALADLGREPGDRR